MDGKRSRRKVQLSCSCRSNPGSGHACFRTITTKRQGRTCRVFRPSLSSAPLSRFTNDGSLDMPGSDSHLSSRKPRALQEYGLAASLNRFWAVSHLRYPRTAKEHGLTTSQQSYASDYLGLGLLLAAYLVIQFLADPFHRMFYLSDPRIQFPHADIERVPVCMSRVWGSSWSRCKDNTVADSAHSSMAVRLRRRHSSRHSFHLGTFISPGHPQGTCHHVRSVHQASLFYDVAQGRC